MACRSGSTPIACSRRCWSRSSSAFPRRCSSAGWATGSAQARHPDRTRRLCRHHRLRVLPRSEIEFYAMAVAVGLVQGGVQSLSRSLFGRLVPEGKSARVLRLLQHDGQVRDRARPAAHRDRRRARAQRARVDHLAGPVVRRRRVSAAACARRRGAGNRA